MARPSVNGPCPCGSGVKYKRCCRPYIYGGRVLDVAQLVRARYTAYAMGETSFIVATTHPERPVDVKSVEVFSWSCDFVGLEILEVKNEDEIAYVTFRALLRQGNRDVSFSERSEFRCVENRWLYAFGTILEENQ